MSPRLADYLEHIRQAATGAQAYLEGLALEEFLDNDFAKDAVMMKFIIIGEAATRIMNSYPEFVKSHPEVPWQNMRGMRNRMAHGYFDINYEIVWQTVQDWLPQMLEALPCLPAESSDEAP